MARAAADPTRFPWLFSECTVRFLQDYDGAAYGAVGKVYRDDSRKAFIIEVGEQEIAPDVKVPEELLQRGVLEILAPEGDWPCPRCGCSNWSAHYMTPESQDVTLAVGDDGTPEEVDFNGCNETYDPEPTTYFQCQECREYINLDGTPRHEKAIDEYEAGPQAVALLRKIRKDTTWFPHMGEVDALLALIDKRETVRA